MTIIQTTKRYESWMAGKTHVVKSDLAFKHTLMRESLFAFFRGTFYNWVHRTVDCCGPDVPQVMAVGDLHVENFGTWRDTEGRLIWGVNDFDEAYPQPYLLDILRLVASAHIATEVQHLRVSPKAATELIWDGYVHSLSKGGRPYVLEEDHGYLRDIAFASLRDPPHFWEKLARLPDCRTLPMAARRALIPSMPARDISLRIKSRRAGVGSLGRPRFVAMCEWRGALVAREAKAVLPSALEWAIGKAFRKSTMTEILKTAIRVPDPFLKVTGGWIVRRLSPHCSRIELSTLPKQRDEERLLHAMGCETANIHLASRRAIKHVIGDARGRSLGSLDSTVKDLVDATKRDWNEWRRSFN